MRPDVSIVITAYNIETYIERAIHSALAQQGVNVEVIFVDDCSTDHTYERAAAIKDDRLLCFHLDKNSGPSAARNAGFAKASGEWIAVLDGDDAYEPHRIINCLKRARELKADVVVDNLRACQEIDGSDFVMFEQKRFSNRGFLDLAGFIEGNSSFFDVFTLGYLKPIFSAAFLRNYQLEYDTGIHIGEDYMMLCEALAYGAVCAIEPSAGYLYTIRSGSISYRLAPSDLERMTACDVKLCNRHNFSTEAMQAQKKRTAAIKDAYAFTLLVQGLKARDIAAVSKAIFLSPTSPRHLTGAFKKRITKLTHFMHSNPKVISR